MRALATCLLTCCLVCLARAQERRAEVIRPETPVQIDSRAQRVDRVVLKLIEGHRVRLAADGLVSPSLDLRGVRRLLADRRVTRLFTRSPEDLDREKAELERLSGRRLADLNSYYCVHTAGKAESEALLSALLEDPAVETAYAEYVPVPCPDIPPATPSFEGRQAWILDPAPRAYSVRQSRSIDGAQGMPGQIVAQLEGAWVLDHEDVEGLVTANVIGTTNFGGYNIPTWYDHGTACAGIIGATRNAYGVVGTSPLSSLRVCSLANGAANMINLCTAVATAGDMFTSSFAFLVNNYHAPVDYPQDTFDAVARAAAKGICYAYGAGNTGADLAVIAPARYGASAVDSGGFIIGATGPGDTARVSWSNYGDKVIANGWGGSVTTVGQGSLFRVTNDNRQDYTASFGGTSAAGPQVGGILASLQGAAMRQNGAPLSLATLRALLTTHGTAITGKIGNRPDLLAMMAAAGTLDGLNVTHEAAIGGRLDTEITAPSGRSFVLMLAFARNSYSVGLNRNLLLDLVTLMPLAVGQIGATGKSALSLGIPNDATLRGQSLFLQALDFTPSVLHLSNSVEGYIR